MARVLSSTSHFSLAFLSFLQTSSWVKHIALPFPDVFFLYNVPWDLLFSISSNRKVNGDEPCLAGLLYLKHGKGMWIEMWSIITGSAFVICPQFLDNRNCCHWLGLLPFVSIFHLTCQSLVDGECKKHINSVCMKKKRRTDCVGRRTRRRENRNMG